jgi:RNA polymerase sigma-70 factor (ECF subfamily)
VSQRANCLNRCENECLAEDGDSQVTELLRRVRQGDQSAPAELMPLVYAELRSVAARCLRRQRPGHTLQPTALVNEAYLRMFGNANPPAADKAHFLAMASQMMRRILVDYARSKGSLKRGGNARRVDASTGLEFAIQDANPLRLLELDLAIDALALENPRFAQAIELHYFGGLTAEEAAEVTGRSVHSIRHDLRFAQAWLRHRLAGERTGG